MNTIMNMKKFQFPNIRLRFAALTSVLLCGAVSACVTSGPPAFSYQSQAKGNAMCSDLFGADRLGVLAPRMPVLPGEIPTRAMLMINEAPSEEEAQAIAGLESAIRNCKRLRAASGYPTSASEDILEARISRLRYDLYNGAIPYAVYNYGLVQALKKHTAFMSQGEQAYAQGKEAGDMKTLSMALNNAVAAHMAASAQTWVCVPDSLGGMSCY